MSTVSVSTVCDDVVSISAFADVHANTGTQVDAAAGIEQRWGRMCNMYLLLLRVIVNVC